MSTSRDYYFRKILLILNRIKMKERTKQIASIIIRRRRAAVAAAILLLKSRRVHRWWVHPINQKRQEQGDWDTLLMELKTYDEEKFFDYTRLSIPQFDFLLSLTENQLTKTDSFRKSIPPGARLAITLRFLATGDSLASVADAFRIGKSTACNVIKETCNVLFEVLSKSYLKPPSEAEWKNIASGYENTWDLPHCLGSIDAKHVLVQAPKQTTVLFAICDSDYNFTYVDIKAYEAQTDGGLLRESSFGRKFYGGTLNLPNDATITNTRTSMSYYFAGDEAFPLTKHLLRPYAGTDLSWDRRVFNCRLSRARACIDNALGVLVARFGVFHRTLNANPETVDSIIKAAVCLHNFIKCTADGGNYYCPLNYADRCDDVGNVILGEWRKEVPLQPALSSVRQLGRRLGTRNSTRTAEEYRTIMKDYVNSLSGSVSWQDDVI